MGDKIKVLPATRPGLIIESGVSPPRTDNNFTLHSVQSI